RSFRQFRTILSSVLDKENTAWMKDLLRPEFIVNNALDLPISLSAYHTPKTLGADRIANCVAGAQLSTTDAALIIDAGTCIKYDVVFQGNYLGGAIAPGIRMRLKALHKFTEALP